MPSTRRRRTHLAAAILAIAGCYPAASWASGDRNQRPNVLVIITDDQGYGDFGFHGNRVIRTPHLDRLAGQSVELTRFYVSPVCAPTRASLLTGRYNYRTGVVDTYIGRAMMHPDEVTLPEMFAAAGYRTGIFGKWHLGDNYPMRPMDQGFQESLVHKGGGIGQPSDLPGGTSYFDPVLLRNGQVHQAQGYCSDVFTQAAAQFIARRADQPFFAYLAFNAPHDPLEVPAEYLQTYQNMDLSREQFPSPGQPLPGKIDSAALAKVYGMITNIDDNLGRLLARLDELDLARSTIVVFLTDNGPAHARYNAGLRGRKGSVYEGGIRVPCLVRFPDRLAAGRKIDQPAAHIDLAPTLLEACAIAPDHAPQFDGTSLWRLLTGRSSSLPERTLAFQWHRGDAPQLYRAFAVRDARWKLLQAQGAAPGPFEPKFELFDVEADPYETTDLADKQPQVVERLKRSYAAWFDDVGATRGYDPPRIHVGSPRESPSILTRQDWRGPQAGWAENSVGHWDIHVDRPGTYRVTILFSQPAGQAQLVLGGRELVQQRSGEDPCIFESVDLDAGPTRLEARIVDGQQTAGALRVQVELTQPR